MITPVTCDREIRPVPVHARDGNGENLLDQPADMRKPMTTPKTILSLRHMFVELGPHGFRGRRPHETGPGQAGQREHALATESEKGVP